MDTKENKGNRATEPLASITSLDSKPSPTSSLRQQAEDISQKRPAMSQEQLDALSPEHFRSVLHDLSVHQIELEIQNEELQVAQRRLEVSQARYFELYNLAPVGYITVSETGLITETNLTAANLLDRGRATLLKRPISHIILKEDQDSYYLLRKKLMQTGKPQACELQMTKGDGSTFWAHLEAASAQDESRANMLRIVLSDITERKRTEEELQKILMENEAQSLSGIGHHLHDGVCQSLVGVCYLSELLVRQLQDSPVKTQTMAAKLLREARQSLGVTRKLAHGLMTSCDDSTSLETCLRNLVKKTGEVFQIPCHLEIQPGADCHDPETTLHLLRIAQEAVTNAIKHAMSQQIWIRLAMRNAVLIMTIENDGKNMKENIDPQNSLGLRLMNYRTKMMGASLEIGPRVAGGTIVRCLLPMRGSEANTNISTSDNLAAKDTVS